MRTYSLPTWKSGSDITAKDLTATSNGISAALNLIVDRSTGLTLHCDAQGQKIARARPPAIWGTLSGSSSPYTFTEAREGSTGAWAAGTRTGTAYEVNNKTGLGGKIARLFPDRLGAWRFQYIGTPVAGRTVIISLIGCTSSVGSGISITLTQSGTPYTQSTNSSGQATFTGLTSSPYTVTAVAPTSYSNISAGPFTPPAGTSSRSLGFAPALGYFCAGCANPFKPSSMPFVYNDWYMVFGVPTQVSGSTSTQSATVSFSYTGGVTVSSVATITDHFGTTYYLWFAPTDSTFSAFYFKCTLTMPTSTSGADYPGPSNNSGSVGLTNLTCGPQTLSLNSTGFLASGTVS